MQCLCVSLHRIRVCFIASIAQHRDTGHPVMSPIGLYIKTKEGIDLKTQLSEFVHPLGICDISTLFRPVSYTYLHDNNNNTQYKTTGIMFVTHLRYLLLY